MIPNSITHTVKYGNIEKNDWYAHAELDVYFKQLDLSFI